LDNTAEGIGDHTIQDANLANDRLCEALKKVNYGIVVGLKVAQSELRRLRKAECDVQRNKTTTVVKNNLRMVKDQVTEKIGIEVSRQAEGQRLRNRLMLKDVLQLGSVD